MSDKLRFGQGSSVKLYIQPQFGRVGTVFRFAATHLNPSNKVKVLILAPEKKRFLLGSKREHIYNDSLKVDLNGNISFEKTATQNWLPGTYTFVVTHIPNDKEVTEEMVFYLTP